MAARHVPTRRSRPGGRLLALRLARPLVRLVLSLLLLLMVWRCNSIQKTREDGLAQEAGKDHFQHSMAAKVITVLPV
jgi:hypothetical protein